MSAITTRSLLLRRFVAEDAAEALALSREEAARAWLPSQVYEDPAHAARQIAFLIDQYALPADPAKRPWVLAVEHRAERRLIGHVGFSPFDDEVEIGFAIGERHQGQGFATEAVVAACGWAFEALRLRRILGITSSANRAAQRVLRHAGFVHQGDRSMQFQGTEQPVSIHAAAPETGAA